MAALIVGGFTCWGIIKLERVNERHQLELRLNADPLIGSQLQRWREAINQNLRTTARPGDRLPTALYYGKVLDYTESKPTFGLMPTCILRLETPQLLAGNPHRSDTVELVSLSYKDHPPKTKPTKAQTLLVAVWRDAQGHNIVDTAIPCDVSAKPN